MIYDILDTGSQWRVVVWEESFTEGASKQEGTSAKASQLYKSKIRYIVLSLFSEIVMVSQTLFMMLLLAGKKSSNMSSIWASCISVWWKKHVVEHMEKQKSTLCHTEEPPNHADRKKKKSKRNKNSWLNWNRLGSHAKWVLTNIFSYPTWTYRNIL